MNDFGVNDIMKNVRKAIGDLNFEHLGDEIQRAVMSEMGGTASTVEREFRVESNSILEIHKANAGDISIVGHDESVIKVEGSVHGSKAEEGESPIEFSQEGNCVRLRAHGLLHSKPVDYTVLVPRDCRPSIQGINPDVDISGIRAGLDLETVGGDVSLEDVGGSIAIRTVHGDIEASGLTGSLQLSTTSGDARISRSDLERFVMQSISGDVTLETSLKQDGQYLYSTTSGDIRLIVPERNGIDVHFKTMSGDVDTNLPTEIISSSRRNWHGRVNGGGARFEMSSTSGDLRIDKGSWRESPSDQPKEPRIPDSVDPRGSAPIKENASGPLDSAPPALPLTSPADETSAVLQALERGEIGVDEAVARLDAAR